MRIAVGLGASHFRLAALDAATWRCSLRCLPRARTLPARFVGGNDRGASLQENGDLDAWG